MFLPSTCSSPVERTAHSYAESLYLLPSDEEERQRLLIQHRLYTRLAFGRLIFPPISFSETDEVLDIGTGGGAWLCDARSHLPESVQLYGIDIEPRLFPSFTPPSTNVHLSVCSATDLPPVWTSKFALIHQRLLICAYTRDQWIRTLQEMYRVVAPGGYVQLLEPGPEWVSGPKTASFLLFMDGFLGKMNMLFHCGALLPHMLKAAGFVDVTSEEVVMNLGKWAGENGVQAKDVTIGGFKSMRDAITRAGALGRFASAEEFERTADEVAEEWDSFEGSYMVMRVCCGRKPLASQSTREQPEI